MMIDPDQMREVGIQIAGALRDIAGALGGVATAIIVSALLRAGCNK